MTDEQDSYERSYELYQRARARMDAGALDEAIDLLRASADLSPHFKTFELLGECLARQRRFAEAVMPLAAATALNDQSRAPALLAEVFLELEDYDEADRFAELSLSRAPDNRRALAVRKAVAARHPRRLTFELAEAFYHLGILAPEDLAGLVPGHDSLADAEAAMRAFAATLAGRAPLERDAAWRVATLEVARAIDAGRIHPYDGAALLSGPVYHAASQPAELTTFYHYATEWEDATERDDWRAYRAGVEAAIRAEAARWLAASGPPPVRYHPLGPYDYQEPPSAPAVQVYWDGADRPAERLEALVDAARRAGWRVHGSKLITFDGYSEPESDVAGAILVLERGTTAEALSRFLLWLEQEQGTRPPTVLRRANGTAAV